MSENVEIQLSDISKVNFISKKGAQSKKELFKNVAVKGVCSSLCGVLGKGIFIFRNLLCKKCDLGIANDQKQDRRVVSSSQ